MGFNFLGKNRIAVFGSILFCLVMVAFPEVTATASKQGILLWLNSIVPTLLPFFIFAGFLKKTGVANRVSPVIYPFVMAVLSGYPMGARIVGDYLRDGLVSKERGISLLSYSMVTGPAFMVGAIGVEFLGSYKCGVVMAVSHYLGALANGVFYSERGMGRGKSGTGEERLRHKPEARETSYYNIFTDAIIDSFKSMAIVLAYIVIFMIICDFVEFSGILDIIGGETTSTILRGMLEMTVGCSSLVASEGSLLMKTTIATFLVSFGGLSVPGQSMSMLGGSDIELPRVLLIKLTHGVLATIIAFSLGCFVL